MRDLRPFGLRALAALALICASASGLQSETTVLGESGEVYSLVSTTLGAVNLQAPTDSVSNPVLGLRVRTADVDQLILVPTTDDSKSEEFANLVFERASGSVYAVWQGFIGIHPVIYIAEYAEGGWRTPILVTRDAFSAKYAPQLVVTRDSLGVGADRLERTILHVVYAQEPSEGEVETLYAPVILHNGRYLGPHATYRLNDMAPDSAPAPGYAISPILARRPALRRGADERSVMASFVDGDTGNLLSVEVSHLPLQLSRVAGEARSQIIIVGAGGMGPRGSALRATFAATIHDRVRDQALAQGFTAETAEALAAVARAVVSTEPDADEAALGRVAAEARSQIIIVGVRGRNHGLESQSLADAYVVSPTGDDRRNDEDLHFSLAARRVAPRSGAEVENRTFVSADGRRVAVSWTDGLRFVRYREADGSTWSDARELNLSDSLTLDDARRMLESKVN